MDKQIRHVILSAQLLSDMFRKGNAVHFRVAEGFPAEVEILQYEPDYTMSGSASPALKITVRGYFDGVADPLMIVCKSLPDEKVDNQT